MVINETIRRAASSDPRRWPPPSETNAAIQTLLDALELLPDLKLWELPERFFASEPGSTILKAYLHANPNEWITIKEAKTILGLQSYQAVSNLVMRGTLPALPNPEPRRKKIKSVLVQRSAAVRKAYNRLE